MKIWIVGAQGTGKSELAGLLADEKFKIGKLFTNISPDTVGLYHKEFYNFYEGAEVNTIFENNAYVFIKDMNIDESNAFDGLDFSEYDSSDVFVLSLEEFAAINTKYITKDDLVIWLDGNKAWRKTNLYAAEHDIFAREKLERSQYNAFGVIINSMRNTLKNTLYFYNEDPIRVKTIIKIINNNPKLKSEFVKNFN